jgi:hypothetical protein
MDTMNRKVKIFATFQDLAALEVELNQWFSENPGIRILNMLQSEANTPQGWNLIITVFYETR